jgi:hypothetical protein
MVGLLDLNAQQESSPCTAFLIAHESRAHLPKINYAISGPGNEITTRQRKPSRRPRESSAGAPLRCNTSVHLRKERTISARIRHTSAMACRLLDVVCKMAHHSIYRHKCPLAVRDVPEPGPMKTSLNPIINRS